MRTHRKGQRATSRMRLEELPRKGRKAIPRKGKAIHKGKAAKAAHRKVGKAIRKTARRKAAGTPKEGKPGRKGSRTVSRM